MKKIVLGAVLAATMGLATTAQAHTFCNDYYVSPYEGYNVCRYHGGIDYYENVRHEHHYHNTPEVKVDVDNDALGVFTLFWLLSQTDSE